MVRWMLQVLLRGLHGLMREISQGLRVLREMLRGLRWLRLKQRRVTLVLMHTMLLSLLRGLRRRLRGRLRGMLHGVVFRSSVHLLRGRLLRLLVRGKRDGMLCAPRKRPSYAKYVS